MVKGFFQTFVRCGRLHWMGGSSSSTIVVITGCLIIDHHRLPCAVIEAASIGHVVLIINAAHD